MKALIAAIAITALFGSAEAADPLKLIGAVSLPGVTGRFDHFAIDNERQRLFVAALGNNTVEVIGISKSGRIASISGVRKPQGVVYIPNKNQIGIACGGDGIFKVFSGDGYKIVAAVPDLDDADNVRLDPRNQDNVFVGYGDGALALIDVNTWEKSGDIKIAGHPESFQVDSGGEQIFVNVPGVKEVAVVDRQKASVRTSFAMSKFKSNFPMALDEANNRVFVGCRSTPRLLALKKENGHELANVEISGDTDDLFYDAKRQCVYVSCGEGFIDVVSASPAQPLKRIAKIPTRSGARTSYFARELDRFFVAVPNRGGEPAEIRIYQPTQP